jgi:hypothetical protein
VKKVRRWGVEKKFEVCSGGKEIKHLGWFFLYGGLHYGLRNFPLTVLGLLKFIYNFCIFYYYMSLWFVESSVHSCDLVARIQNQGIIYGIYTAERNNGAVTT